MTQQRPGPDGWPDHAPTWPTPGDYNGDGTAELATLIMPHDSSSGAFARHGDDPVVIDDIAPAALPATLTAANRAHIALITFLEED